MSCRAGELREADRRDVRDHDPENQALVEWIVAGRPLEVVGLAELPERVS
jgi:hypothetical protein